MYEMHFFTLKRNNEYDDINNSYCSVSTVVIDVFIQCLSGLLAIVNHVIHIH